MKKLLSFLLLVSIGNFGVFAQSNDSLHHLELLKEAPYIFRGEAVSKEKPFEVDGKLYASIQIAVRTIYKGSEKLKGDTIQLIYDAPSSWTLLKNGELLKNYSSDELEMTNLDLRKGATGVFVCKNVKNIDFNSKNLRMGLWKINFNHFKMLSPVCAEKDCFFNYYIGITNKEGTHLSSYTAIIKGFGISLRHHLKNKIDEDGKSIVWKTFENYLSEKGIISKNKKKDVTFSNGYLENAKNDSIYQRRVESYQKRHSKILKHIQKSKKNHDKSSASINFEIKNQKVTGTSTKYFEFDILVWSNGTGTYLQNSAFVIQYNTTPFGTNIVQNNNVEITKGTNFNTSTYIDPMSIAIDDANDAIRFAIGDNSQAGSWNRTEITPVKQQLVHIKIKIQNCVNTTDLKFLDIQNVTDFAFYTDNPTEGVLGTYYTYDVVNYHQPSNFHLCPPPTIESFSPHTISSGTKSVLTIKGFGFGNQRGNGQIWLSRDNNGQDIVKYFDYIDYKSWSDTMIKFEVPSIVDTSAGTQDGGWAPGSGKIKIRRNDGIFSSFSNSPLIISYAVENYSLGSDTSGTLLKLPERKVIDTVSTNFSNSSICFYLDTSISNYPMRKAIVKQALNDWKCKTKINWKIVGDTILPNSGSFNLNDGVSLIFMTNSLPGSEDGQTQKRTYACRDINGNHFIYPEEIDMGFLRNPSHSWYYDSTSSHDVPSNKVDFYSVVLHEFGHALGLDHVNQSYDVMFYQSTPGPITASNLPNLQNSPYSVDGGIFIVNKSLSPIICDNKIPLTYAPTTECSDVGAVITNKLDQEIVVYPNPTDEKITISLNSNFKKVRKIILLNNLGQIVKSLKPKTSHNKTFKMNISNLSNGIYFIRIDAEKESITKKIIIQ